MERDESGRLSRSPGFDVQARIFAGLGVFFTVISIVYGFLTYEWAGTVMLALASGLAFLVGAYLGLEKPDEGVGVEEEDAGDDQPWFPEASVWPFAIGAGAALVANGLLLGAWLALPASALLAYALYGFVRQGRQRA